MGSVAIRSRSNALTWPSQASTGSAVWSLPENALGCRRRL